MTGFDVALGISAFVLILAIGGAWADSWERRDARQRNRSRYRR